MVYFWNGIMVYFWVNINNFYSEDEISTFRERYTEDPSNYDWQKEILSGSGFTQDHFVSLKMNYDKISAMPSFYLIFPLFEKYIG